MSLINEHAKKILNLHGLEVSLFENDKRIIKRSFDINIAKLNSEYEVRMQNVQIESKDISDLLDFARPYYIAQMSHHTDIKELNKKMQIEISHVDKKMSFANKCMAKSIGDLVKVNGDLVDGTNMIGMWQMVKKYYCNCQEKDDGICRGHGIEQFEKRFVPLETEYHKIEKRDETSTDNTLEEQGCWKKSKK